MWKRGEIAPQDPHYFIYIFLTSGVKLHIHLLNVVVQFIVFLTLSTLICRITDTCISKCFSKSLGIRDNGSRLYISNSISLFCLVCIILSTNVLPCIRSFTRIFDFILHSHSRSKQATYSDFFFFLFSPKKYICKLYSDHKINPGPAEP